MTQSSGRSLLRVVFVVVTLLATVCTASATLQLDNVNRVIDVRTPFVREIVYFQLHNQKQDEGGDGESVEWFEHAVPASLRDRVSFVRAEAVPRSANGQGDPENAERAIDGARELFVDESTWSFDERRSVHTVRVHLHKPLEAGKKRRLRLVTVYVHALRPLPATMEQTASQNVFFEEALQYVVSPYKVVEQSTRVVLPSRTVLSRTERSGSRQDGRVLHYGPFRGVLGNTLESLSFHFEFNKPLASITHMRREFEISHWGNNLAVETSIDVRNDAASHRGEWSRWTHQMNPRSGQAALLELYQTLPLNAQDIYYRDVIGNISTSRVEGGGDFEESLRLALTPRFPIFGGWKTSFLTGYNVPLNRYLGAGSRSDFLITLPFGDSFDNIVVDELEVRVVLPEGATNVRSILPFDVDAESRDTLVTYLDTSGRPVVVLRKRNVVEEHNLDFQVAYDLSTTSLLKEPLLLIGGYLALFLSAIVLVRVQLSIAPTDTSSEATSDALVALIDSLKKRHAQRLAEVQSFASNPSNRTGVAQKVKTHEQAVRTIINQIVAIDEDAADLATLVEEAEQSRIDACLGLVDVEQANRNNKSSQGYNSQLHAAKRILRAADDDVDAAWTALEEHV